MNLPEADRIAVREIELLGAIAHLDGLADYDWVWILARLDGTPVGYFVVPTREGCVEPSVVRDAVLAQLGPDLSRLLIERWLANGCPPTPAFARLARRQPGGLGGAWPKVTVAVCTRDRPQDLERCLNSLVGLDYENLELLVVDNAPSDEAGAQVVARFPNVRYVREVRPGLDWARNRAAREAAGEIVAYTDDDVAVDPGWVEALATVFAENSAVMAVTGLVVPLELETPSQVHFERNGGFARGCLRRWFGVNVAAGEHAATRNADMGKCGTGANMAFRKCVFDSVGHFDPALDVGTPTNGGGDLEMFFRVLKGGYLLVYEPKAVVWHRHRRNYPALRTQIANNGVGYYSFLARAAFHFPDERVALLRFGAWWLAYHSTRRFVYNALRGRQVKRDLAAAELVGSLVGMCAYQKARRAARDLAAGEQLDVDHIRQVRPAVTHSPHAIAVRQVAVESITALTDVEGYAKTRIYVTHRGQLIGHVDVPNLFGPISSGWLRDAIAENLWLSLAESVTGESQMDASNAIVTSFFAGATDSSSEASIALQSAPDKVSIVIATLDRPNDLRRCLRSLETLIGVRDVEIVVVDNCPESGLTPPVVRDFPQVHLVSEPRRGLSRARNRGILDSSGDIVVSTDDDVVVDPHWLSWLLAPFTRRDVYAVTGNTLPLELETVPQQLFESYGGLGRGYQRREVGGVWFREQRGAVPTWTLGATANAAFRAAAFRDARIGLFDEVLGPGTPTGVGEDTYLFYRILKADRTIVYEPRAIVWHRHRETMAALEHQLFNYSKGHVAYHLYTLARDNDRRALVQLFKAMPKWRVKQLLQFASRKAWGEDVYPLSLILLELTGHVLGPFELLRAQRRLRKLETEPVP